MTRLEAYQKAVNKIDDYFEYRHESEVDKSEVRVILSQLTKNLIKAIAQEIKNEPRL